MGRREGAKLLEDVDAPKSSDAKMLLVTELAENLWLLQNAVGALLCLRESPISDFPEETNGTKGPYQGAHQIEYSLGN